ncbi:D-lactate ferricytochrome c oxidoreductase [Cyanidiococcus yangmingshanensis]|uniref:D-lactate dehydrogenase (cytochrome) n=1 Tax=Cyanidiococcus yangmingshanensis TaxID=2690220 RepID=A0A7J7INK7_9RHOD|nr:D-lactate ferricytochrome c oxidoreductase [Cyanidiococcus yangmingshanensis]
MASTRAASFWRLVGSLWSRRLVVASSLVGVSAAVTYTASAKEFLQTERTPRSSAKPPSTGQSLGALHTTGTTPRLSETAPESARWRVQPETLRRALELIQREQPQLEVSLEPSHLDSHARDVSFHEPHSPDAVIYPRSAEEVATVLRYATEFRIPVVPYAAATSLEGHVVPRYGGITVDCSRMDRILVVRPADMDCDVEPGVGWEALNEHLRKYGLFFAPDPGPGACIGGMVGTSCSGTNAARYGTMRENVLSLEVVLPSGAIIRQTRARARKSSAGYDLTRLFVGAEGTLGIVTKATLRLRPIPAYKGVVKCTFDRLEDAAATVQEVLGPTAAVSIGRCELLDRLAVHAVNLSTNHELRLDESRHLLLFELVGESLDVIREQASRVRSCAEQHHLHEWRMAAAPHVIGPQSSTEASSIRDETSPEERPNLRQLGASIHPSPTEVSKSAPEDLLRASAEPEPSSRGPTFPETRRTAGALVSSTAPSLEQPTNRDSSSFTGDDISTKRSSHTAHNSIDAGVIERGATSAVMAAADEANAALELKHSLAIQGNGAREAPQTSSSSTTANETEQRLWQEREELWRARKVAYWAAYELRPGAEIWTTDVAVPLSKLADVLGQTQEDIEQTNRVAKERGGQMPALLAPLVAHAADGNFHLLMLVDPHHPAEMERAQQVNDRLVRRAIAAGGTCTGEHGIGEGKRRYLVAELGPEAVALMQRIKEAIDPAGVMNPGKVLPDPVVHEA